MKAIDTLKKERREAYDHSIRVGDYAFMLALSLGESVATAEVWQEAGYLHDIGKLTIPEEILNAPRKLTDSERAVVATHTTAGRDILQSSNMRQEYIDAAEYHHTHYKNGGKTIPLVARVIAVVDVYDALTAKRCYKEGMAPSQAFKIMDRMQEENLQFDPDIYRVWKKAITTTDDFIISCVA